MSKIEDFKNAPVGAIATHEATGIRAFKTEDQNLPWTNSQDNYLTHADMADEGYTLDPEAPTTVREALDLAWELAHPVKNGQVIPKGTQYLGDTGSGVKEYIAPFDIKIGFHSEPERRTLEPLPEPDWLDAPAALDVCGCCGTETLHSPIKRGTCWECTECHTTKTWRALTDVTPLYPKEDA